MKWTEAQYNDFISKSPQNNVRPQKVLSNSVNQPAAIEPKKQKYNNVKINAFDSKHEYNCYKNLELRQKIGEITALICQVTFNLINGVSYKADFTYYDKTVKAFIVADAKGMKTKEYIIKKKMMKELLGIEILEL